MAYEDTIIYNDGNVWDKEKQYKRVTKELIRYLRWACQELNEIPIEDRDNWPVGMAKWWENEKIKIAQEKEDAQKAARKQEIKEAALSKLTDEEKEALGLKLPETTKLDWGKHAGVCITSKPHEHVWEPSHNEGWIKCRCGVEVSEHTKG